MAIMGSVTIHPAQRSAPRRSLANADQPNLIILDAVGGRFATTAELTALIRPRDSHICLTGRHAPDDARRTNADPVASSLHRAALSSTASLGGEVRAASPP